MSSFGLWTGFIHSILEHKQVETIKKSYVKGVRANCSQPYYCRIRHEVIRTSVPFRLLTSQLIAT